MTSILPDTLRPPVLATPGTANIGAEPKTRELAYVMRPDGTADSLAMLC